MIKTYHGRIRWVGKGAYSEDRHIDGTILIAAGDVPTRQGAPRMLWRVPVVRPSVTVTRIESNPDDIAAAAMKRFYRSSARTGKAFHVIDLSALTTLNTNALGVLISALRASHQIGGRVRLAAVSPRVLDVLSFTALDRLMPVYANWTEAKAAFAECGRALRCSGAAAKG